MLNFVHLKHEEMKNQTRQTVVNLLTMKYRYITEPDNLLLALLLPCFIARRESFSIGRFYTKSVSLQS